MTDKNHRTPTCPACGQRVSSSFFPVKVNEKVKVVLVILLLIYMSSSVFLCFLSIPPGFMLKHGQPVPGFPWMQPIAREPMFQGFVAGGIALGILVFYWEWGQTLFENWREKRGDIKGKPSPAHRYTCRSCGHQWNEGRHP
jgi:hypothetical protein